MGKMERYFFGRRPETFQVGEQKREKQNSGLIKAIIRVIFLFKIVFPMPSGETLFLGLHQF